MPPLGTIQATILFARFEDRPLVFTVGKLLIGEVKADPLAWRVDFEALAPDDALIRTTLEKSTGPIELIDGRGRRYLGEAVPAMVSVGGPTQAGLATFLARGPLSCR